MPGFRIAPNAKTALRRIASDSLSNFGREQTDRYMAGFQRTFDLLAQFPGIAKPVNQFRRGLLRYRYETNYIFFTAEPDYILIREVFHTAQNITKKMFR